MLPSDSDEELAALMRQWREKKPYNAREGLE
jgi:hypothetical protein